MKLSQALLRSLFLGSIFLLGACAKHVSTVPLSQQVYTGINKSEIALLQNQQEVEFEIVHSQMANAAGGGLLMALIDIAVDGKRAEDAAEFGQPIKKALADFDFNKVIKEKTESLISTHAWLNAGNLETISGLAKPIVEEKVEKSQSDAFGLIKPKYKMNPTFSSVYVQLDFAVYPVRDDLKKLAEGTRDETVNGPILKINGLSTVHLPKPSADPLENAKIWAHNNGVELKKALNNALDEVISKLNRDLEAKHLAKNS